jgi:hypothetical protein
MGSSDFHFSGRVGACRTFLFVMDATERGVLDAIRKHRTVVYGKDGRAFGDAALVQLADSVGLRDVAASYTRARGSLLDWISRVAAGAGLLGIVLATRPRASRPGAARRESGPRVPERFP